MRSKTRTPASESEKVEDKDSSKKGPREGQLPSQDRPNPYVNADLPPFKVERARATHVIKGHTMAVSS